MAQVLPTVLESHTQGFFDSVSFADSRLKDRLFIKYPLFNLTIVVFYLYFCMKSGPSFMQNRKPFELRKTLIIYNAVQVLISIYIVCEAFASGWMTNTNLLCQPLDYSNNPISERMANLTYIYLVAKNTELLDTVLFVLRKKFNQVTFLHVYHHSSMPILCWIGARYFTVGHVNLFGVINSFVHIFMYTYYLIAAFGPQYYKYLWWKRYITLMQLVQFSIVFIQNLISLFIGCNYPKTIHYIIMYSSALFIVLFGRFYVKTYKRESDKSKNGNWRSKSNGKNKIG